MRVALRVVIGVLIAAIVAIAMVPLLVIRDLNRGGTGWGLCSEGLDGCTTSYFVGFELVALLVALLALVLIGLRVATRSLRFVEHRYDRKAGAAATPRGEADRHGG